MFDLAHLPLGMKLVVIVVEVWFIGCLMIGVWHVCDRRSSK